MSFTCSRHGEIIPFPKMIQCPKCAAEELGAIDKQSTNSQSAAALKDCIQLFASLKLALGVLKTMCRVAGLNGGMQKAVDMDLWIDEMVERLNAEAALRT
jgi:hypothetical protein